jgi:DNA-binding MarR family transcriptional regulator
MDVTTPVNCTCLGLRKAARAVTQMYDEALRPSGLRGTQFSLLFLVEREGPCGITEVARMLVMDRTTLTRNLKPLLDQKLLEVVDGPDRRRRPIAITAKGREVLARALPLWREVQERLAVGLGRSRWWGLLGDLRSAVELARAE